MTKIQIQTLADAVRFFHRLRIEVIETEGGWILHWLEPNEGDYELGCDTTEELIDYARAQQEAIGRPPADRDARRLRVNDASSKSPAQHHEIPDSCSSSERRWRYDGNRTEETRVGDCGRGKA